MKNIIITVICFILLVSGANAQNEKPELLKEPASWEFERFALPPAFSARFPYSGVEELRFSPGMFHKDSTDYFSYAFVAQLNNTVAVTQQEVKNYLLLYFKGLCGSTARERNLSIDTSQITVSIGKKNNTTFNATLKVFGVFADGAPVTLNAEIKVFNQIAAKRTYLVFIASPQRKKQAVWQQLYKIQRSFIMPND